jgi:nucleoid DNA-binding protein
MEETIIALLNNNLRVIIPDFGAFIIRQKQPRIIVFNEFLRYNDGILIDFIVKTEGIDREIAEQRVADFAEDGTKLLASGRELVIEGLGSLKKDSSGKINFIEAPEIIEIDNKDEAEPEITPEPKMTPEPEIIPEPEEKQEIPQNIDQEIPASGENSQVIEPEITSGEEISQPDEQAIPATPKSKTAARSKSKAKKTPAKVKPARPTKPLTKSLSPAVPLGAVEPASVEPEAALEAAPVEKQEAIEAAPVEKQEAIEAAPVEKQEAIEAAPAEQEADTKTSGALTQEAVDDAIAEFRPQMEPAAKLEPQVIEHVLSPDGKPPRANESDDNFNRPGAISTNRILAWVLIILFINAGILGWFVFRNKSKGAKAEKSPITMISDTLYDQLADSVRAAASDSSIVYNETEDEKNNPGQNALAPGSRYYIVAGCFRDEINADSLVSSLKLLGYKAEKFGKIGNLFAVCFASFDDKDKAVSELKKIREKVPSAWMTKF